MTRTTAIYGRATYLRSARMMTAVSDSPRSSAFAFAADHRSSGTRKFRSGVATSGDYVVDARLRVRPVREANARGGDVAARVVLAGDAHELDDTLNGLAVVGDEDIRLTLNALRLDVDTSRRWRHDLA